MRYKTGGLRRHEMLYSLDFGRLMGGPLTDRSGGEAKISSWPDSDAVAFKFNAEMRSYANLEFCNRPPIYTTGIFLCKILQK